MDLSIVTTSLDFLNLEVKKRLNPCKGILSCLVMSDRIDSGC